MKRSLLIVAVLNSKQQSTKLIEKRNQMWSQADNNNMVSSTYPYWLHVHAWDVKQL